MNLTEITLTREKNTIIVIAKKMARKKRSRRLSLTEKETRRLEGFPRKRSLKVALEPGG